MCGVFGLVAHEPVNQLLYDGLQMLQHRGQDAAGIVTTQGNSFFMHKGKGMVREVFRTRNMRDLHGNAGIAHVRYPTAGNAGSPAEAQPFYVSSPFGIVLAHNGNLTNTQELAKSVSQEYLRHINTQSDSEVLLNVLAHEIRKEVTQSNTPHQLTVDTIFNAITRVQQRVCGAYGVVAMIAGYGMVAFRDPNGIRPLVLGRLEENGKTSYGIASESVVFNSMGYELMRDIAPGEAIFIDFDGQFYSRQCHGEAKLRPCLFEYVYFARPDSIIDNVPVYQARADMGITLAEKVKKTIDLNDIDVVMAIPDTSRPSAMELARHLGKPYREGLIKNRYIGRTFIMPGQATRKKSVRQKLNPIPSEFKDKNVLLVDDSIVRGTTSREIVDMVREAGAKKVFFASAAPEVRWPNVYGIDMPTREELIANGRSTKEIAQEINADACIFQDLNELEQTIINLNPKIEGFDNSCFSGCYITGDINQSYLDQLSANKQKPSNTAVSNSSKVDHNVSIDDSDENE